MINESCDCAEQPKAFYLIRNLGDEFPQGLEKVDIHESHWIALYQCSKCRQYWQLEGVSPQDRRSRLISKVNEIAGWKEHDYEKGIRTNRISLLIEGKGGLSDEKCVWQGCDKKALKGFAYCPECAYDKAKLGRG